MRTLIFTAAMLLGTTVLASNPHRYDAKFRKHWKLYFGYAVDWR